MCFYAMKDFFLKEINIETIFKYAYIFLTWCKVFVQVSISDENTFFGFKNEVIKKISILFLLSTHWNKFIVLFINAF